MGEGWDEVVKYILCSERVDDRHWALFKDQSRCSSSVKICYCSWVGCGVLSYQVPFSSFLFKYPFGSHL
jgi:hypothetical protein